MALQNLNDRFHFFPKIGVGHAENRDVGDLWMADQDRLDLLRVDIDSSRYDHEGLSVDQIKIPLFIDPPDIAQRRPTQAVAGFGRFLRVVVVRKIRPIGKINQARLADRNFSASIVTNMNHAERSAAQRCADTAGGAPAFAPCSAATFDTSS